MGDPDQQPVIKYLPPTKPVEVVLAESSPQSRPTVYCVPRPAPRSRERHREVRLRSAVHEPRPQTVRPLHKTLTVVEPQRKGEESE